MTATNRHHGKVPVLYRAKALYDRLRRAGGPTYLRSSESLSFEPLAVDVEAVLSRLKIRQHYWEVAERLLARTEHVTVRYEEDLQDAARHQATADRMFEFLEIRSAPVTTSLRRINVHPLSKLVANYDELAAALFRTPWAAQLTGEAQEAGPADEAGEAGDGPSATTGATT